MFPVFFFPFNLQKLEQSVVTSFCLLTCVYVLFLMGAPKCCLVQAGETRATLVVLETFRVAPSKTWRAIWCLILNLGFDAS